MASAKKSEDCKNGTSCFHLATGKCRYRHPAGHMAKAKSSKVSGQIHAKMAPQVRPKLDTRTIIHMGRLVLKRKTALEGAKAAVVKMTEPPKGFIMVPDSKAPPMPTTENIGALQELYEAELKVARQAIGSMFGSKPIRFMLPSPGVWNSTVTTGVVDAVFTLDASLATEWSSLAAIFDEYRFAGGHFDFSVTCPSLVTVMGTSALSSAAVLGFGFDPSDATVAASIGTIAQLEQHKLFFPRLLATSASATANSYTAVFNNTNGRPMTFRWKTGEAASFTGNGGAVGVGDWKATQGNVSSFPDGVIKPYWSSGQSLAAVVIVGVYYWEIHFRMRT